MSRKQINLCILKNRGIQTFRPLSRSQDLYLVLERKTPLATPCWRVWPALGGQPAPGGRTGEGPVRRRPAVFQRPCRWRPYRLAVRLADLFGGCSDRKPTAATCSRRPIAKTAGRLLRRPAAGCDGRPLAKTAGHLLRLPAAC